MFSPTRLTPMFSTATLFPATPLSMNALKFPFGTTCGDQFSALFHAPPTGPTQIALLWACAGALSPTQSPAAATRDAERWIERADRRFFAFMFSTPLELARVVLPAPADMPAAEPLRPPSPGPLAAT